MATGKGLILLVFLSACCGLTSAHWFGFSWWSAHHRLFKDACLSRNTTSGDVTNRTCGCRNETAQSVQCSWTGLTKTDRYGNVIEATFCDIQPVWNRSRPFRGVLRYACGFQTVEGADYAGPPPPFTCPWNVQCNRGPINVVLNGTDVMAFLCNFGEIQEMMYYRLWPGNGACIPLECPDRSWRGWWGWPRWGRGRGSGGHRETRLG